MGITRRTFIAGMAAGAGALSLGGIETLYAAPGYDLSKSVGGTPYGNTVAAVKALGGMERFVKKGQTVAVLPNVGWAVSVEQNGNTNPQVLKAVLDMALAAGAKSVIVFCKPCNSIKETLRKSGAQEVIDQTKAWFEPINAQGWVKTTGPKGCTKMSTAEIYHLVRDTDVLINVPVLKHHGGAQVTMCQKNLMGLVNDRGIMHKRGLTETIPDLNLMVKPDLNVLDATRVLTAGGPRGNKLSDVVRRDTVFAGTNAVEVDALGCQLFGVQPSSIRHIAEAAKRGMGLIDIASLRVSNVRG